MDKKLALFFFALILLGFTNISYAQNDSSYVRTEKEEEVISKKKPFKERGEPSKFKENLFFGLYPGFAWSNYDFSYEISPLAGVEIFPKFSVGLGILYKNTGGTEVTQSGLLYKYKLNNIGGRAFAFYDVYRNFCAYVEYEGAQVYYSDKLERNGEIWLPALKTGLLYKSQMSQKFYINFLVLYNLLNQEIIEISRDIYFRSNPLEIRIGLAFFPFRS